MPGYPRRHPSRPDPEAHAPDVYEILEGFDGRIGQVEGHVLEIKKGQADTLTELRVMAATDRHATAKLIAGLVATAITVIGGQRLLASSAAQPPPPITRSALDVRLDMCRPMAPGPSREECFARVMAETEH